MDWPTLAQMVAADRSVAFRFIGPCEQAPQAVRAAVNARFEGLRPLAHVIEAAAEVDVWLMCYAAERSVNAATNSHKLLEYLATGAPVVCNRVASYAEAGLIETPASFSNADLPALLAQVLACAGAIADREARRRRIAHALDHRYAAHVRRISGLLDALGDAARRS
jgi:hypothetical protein